MDENIGNGLEKLASALAKAQGEFHTVTETGVNPHLGNRYATFGDIVSAVRAPLAKNGLSFVQLLGTGDRGELLLRTVLMHESGQTLSSEIVINATGESKGINAMQAFGSSVTYMKRYTLSALLGIATGEDADGEGASRPKQQPAPARKAPAHKNELDEALGREDAKPNGKCPVCHANGAHHAPWCAEIDGVRVDTRKVQHAQE